MNAKNIAALAAVLTLAAGLSACGDKKEAEPKAAAPSANAVVPAAPAPAKGPASGAPVQGSAPAAGTPGTPGAAPGSNPEALTSRLFLGPEKPVLSVAPAAEKEIREDFQPKTR